MKSSMVPLVLLAVAPCGMDVSGKWSGTGEAKLKNGTQITGTLFLILQRQGDGRITGSAGCDEEGAKPIENGRMDGSKVRFEMTDPKNGAVTRFEFRLTHQDRLEGEAASVVNGEHRRMTLNMRRVKPSRQTPEPP